MDTHEKVRVPARVVIVSNRLPITIQEKASGLQFRMSTGGLATGLRSIHQEQESLWIGWPGAVSKKNRPEVEARLPPEHGCLPVFLSDRLADLYYRGFSNRTIWPLFHSFPGYARYAAAEWEAYKEVNALFCEAVAATARPGDLIWVHDYHLMLLPRYLRERLPDASIGFFLHIPFPHHDIFRMLPQHCSLVEGLVSADLVGFHTHDYAEALLGCVRRQLGYDNRLGQLMVGKRVVQVDVFPLGIDYERYSGGAGQKTVRQKVGAMRARLEQRKIVFSVSRLDYTKGIPQSLEAIEEFLRRYPEWREKVVFFLVVVPSRETVERYASVKRQIDEMIGRINSSFGTLDWAPIRYMYRSLDFEELVTLYSASDVALIAPLRDGMNLIAKEYLAAKNDGRGVLILSEMAGTAKELLEALIVNPNSREEVVEALQEALRMPEEEQIRRNSVMRKRLETHGVKRWVSHFLNRLRDTVHRSQEVAVKMLDGPARQRLIEEYASARQRLIVLDYDGTLVLFADGPDQARPDAELLEDLGRLSSCPGNEVVVLSGRDRLTLDAWLGCLGITLAAEHGGWLKKKGREEWEPTVPAMRDAWKGEIRPILELYVDRIPGSFVEEKFFSLVWHYRKADGYSGPMAAKELLDTLTVLAANLEIHVQAGQKTVEIKTVGIGKGTFYTRFLARDSGRFILAAGDDWTDEDLFAVLPRSAHTIKVGMGVSRARFNVASPFEFRELLRVLNEVESRASDEGRGPFVTSKSQVKFSARPSPRTPPGSD